MALQKDYTTRYGVTATYHKVRDVREGFIEIDIYYSKEARDEGRDLLESTSTERLGLNDFSYDEAALKEVGKSPKVLAYEYLKSTSQYSGSIDV